MTDENFIDARGLSCPQPVVLASKAVVQGLNRFSISVDNEASKENVTRYLTSKSFEIEYKTNGDDIVIKATK